MLDIFICEDELMQRREIEDVIQNYVMIEALDMRLQLTTGNPQELLEYLYNYPQTKGIFFLDIDLKAEIDGIQLGSEIRNRCVDSKIVFITTHQECLPLTFTYKVEAMDFISKDLPEKMKIQIQEALKQACHHDFLQNNQTNTHIQLKIGSRVRSFPLSEILFFETASTPHKIRLHCINGTTEFYGKINEIIPLSLAFIRVHNSFVVNRENIASVDRKNREIIMINGEVCLASARLLRNVKVPTH